MPRIYNVLFEDVSVSVAQDLLQIKGATGKILRVRRVWLAFTDTTLPTAQGFKVRCRHLGATVTDGTGGSSPTPTRTDPGDAAASFTALANNTTKATTAGTATIVHEHGGHLYAGHEFAFLAPTPVGPSQSFVYELLGAPSGTVKFSGGAEVEEIGG